MTREAFDRLCREITDEEMNNVTDHEVFINQDVANLATLMLKHRIQTLERQFALLVNQVRFDSDPQECGPAVESKDPRIDRL